ncbi:MAG: lipid A deacylase LpxR family protein [Planctomycetes bacterium]|nr:lipid A deacylase LpxR family protein [Planctomycetota bacterium]
MLLFVCVGACTVQDGEQNARPLQQPTTLGSQRAADSLGTEPVRDSDSPLQKRERRALGTALRAFVENDFFSIDRRTDRYYTNGMRLEWNLPPSWTPGFVDDLARSLPLFPSEPDEVSLGLSIGHQIFTPADITDPNPRPEDRPYAGWLYGGLTLRSLDLDEDAAQHDAIHVLELQLGVVGPSSAADRVQTEWHEWFDLRQPQGWQYQLRDEPGIDVSYTHARRLVHFDAKTVGIPFEGDILANVGGTLGTVHMQASAGGIVRFGFNLPRDFGIGTIQTSVGDAGQRDAPPLYVFAGAQGRAVAHNMFLDGNLAHSGPSVDREPLVGELRAGAVIGLGPVDLAYTFVVQSPEFRETRQSQQFGSLLLSISFR